MPARPLILTAAAILAAPGLAAAHGGHDHGAPQPCGPTGATATIGGRTVDLVPMSATCRSAGTFTDATGVTVDALMGQRPALQLRPGQRLRVRFAQDPSRVVDLQVYRQGAPAGVHTAFRLSPYAPTWRVRGARGGVAVVTTTFARDGYRADVSYALRFGIR